MGPCDVVVRRGSQILLVPQVSDSTVMIGEIPADIFGSVFGRVVGYDEFEVFECLTKDRLDGFFDVILAVIYGESDRNAGHIGPSLGLVRDLFGSRQRNGGFEVTKLATDSIHLLSDK